MNRETMSLEDFRAKVGKPKPAKKARRKQRDLQTQYADSKTKHCPPGCVEGDRLYRNLRIALEYLEQHRKSH